MNNQEALALLGLEGSPGDEEINRAFRKKALGCHPDKFKGDKAKEEEFKQINEAKEILIALNPSNAYTHEHNFSAAAQSKTEPNMVDVFRELLKEVGIDVASNLPKIIKLDKESQEFFAISLGELYENQCLNQENFNFILEHIDFPRKKYSISNPYVEQVIIHDLLTKNNLTEPGEVPLEYAEKMRSALQDLPARLFNQENLALLYEHPKDAENIAYALTRLDRVGLLSNENKAFCMDYLKQAGSEMFASLAYNLLHQSKAACEKILVDTRAYFDRTMQRQTQMKSEPSEAEQRHARQKLDALKQHTQTIRELNRSNQAPFEAFIDQVHKTWVRGNSGINNEHLTALKQAFDEGLLTADDLKVDPLVLYSLAGLSLSGIGAGDDVVSRNTEDRFEVLREGFLTIQELENISKIQLNPYQTGALDIILSNEGLEALRRGLPIVEDAKEAAKMKLPALVFAQQVKAFVVNTAGNDFSVATKNKTEPQKVTFEQYTDFCHDFIKRFGMHLEGMQPLNAEQFNQVGSKHDLECEYCLNGSLLANLSIAFDPIVTSISINDQDLFGQSFRSQFNIHQIDPSHPLLTPEGREEAYNKLPALMGKGVFTRGGRLDVSLDEVQSKTGVPIHKIESMIQEKIDAYQQAFSDANTLDDKNRMLIAISDLYEQIRDPEKLKILFDKDLSKAFREQTQATRNDIHQVPAAVKAAKAAWQKAQSSGKTVIDSDVAANEAGQGVLKDMKASREFRATHKSIITEIKGNAAAEKAAKAAWKEAQSSGKTLLQSDEAANKAGEDMINDRSSGQSPPT